MTTLHQRMDYSHQPRPIPLITPSQPLIVHAPAPIPADIDYRVDYAAFAAAACFCSDIVLMAEGFDQENPDKTKAVIGVCLTAAPVGVPLIAYVIFCISMLVYNKCVYNRFCFD